MFTHRPLDSNASAFRLLRVLPERRDNRIQVQLWNDNIGQSDAYRCLSYTWGDPVDTDTIGINGQPFPVRRNLHDFLEAVIRSAMFQPLWIDALCIDQRNDIEKASQVGRMREVYAKSAEVIVWLTDSADLQPFIEWVHSGAHSSMADEILPSFTFFTQHPYWKRTWITQEILLASSIHIWCEHGRLDWKTLGDALVILDVSDPQIHRRRSHLLDKETRPSYLPHLFVMEWRRKLAYQPNFPWTLHGADGHSLKTDFWEILGWRWWTHCSLVADHIFGLSGLIEKSSQFKISYQESLSTTFWRAGEYYEGWQSTAFMTLLKDALQISPDTLQYPPLEYNLLRIRLRLAPLMALPRESLSSRQECTEYADILCVSCSIQLEPTSHQDVLLCADWQGRSTRLRATFIHVLLSPVSGVGGDYTVKVFPGPPLHPFDAPSHSVSRRSHTGLPSSGTWSALTAPMNPADTDRNWEILLPATYVVACLEALELPDDDIKSWHSLKTKVDFPTCDNLQSRWIGKAYDMCDYAPE
ncbi:heterokaryon incompatibility protein-domain-containing protein [Paraphoma chrysanthemicola]|uniref:Heterokaryon incompatibility protein-domain-containing protein n=1 Tax=Paraphoma chrysanthemicola TaxID=798071 RepID=A0A8K0VT18_9PLEO|nr:heterokaryon incompatibility protein-domain-containing protein [Paraphoma chrysanthemicola]